MIERMLFFFLLLSLSLVTATASYARDKPGYKNEGRYDVLLLKGNKAHGKHRGRRHSFGMVIFEREAPTFNFRLHALGLKSRQDYTLIYFPDPFPGNNLLCLGHDVSGKRGKLKFANRIDINSNLPAVYDENYPDGARLRLVPSSDVDCDNRRFVDWRPAAYLYETRLVKYTDTDVVIGYSGRWCMVLEQEGGETWITMDLEQSGSEVTAIAEGYEFTGTVSGNNMILSGLGPDDLMFTIELVFSEDGESFAGTVNTTVEIINVTGTKGPCFDYEEPVGPPECILPMQEPGLVTGGQQFNSEYAGVVHTGLDFRFDSPLPTIVAPCDGVVTGINVHPIALDNLIVDVNIRYNAEWNYFIAFEPYSPDPLIADQQRAEIDVTIGQVVHRGDVLGRLVVPGGTEFPHIHWGVTQGGVGDVCPRDILTVEQQAELDAMYETFMLSPPCLLPP